MDKRNVTGVMVNYYRVCTRKLWLDYHNIEFHDLDENVRLGRKLQNDSYRDNKNKDSIIDGTISVDSIENGVVKEVKKSSALKDASLLQLKYYLYYLTEYKGFEELTGVLSLPDERKEEKIELDEDDKEEILDVLDEVEEIVSRDSPPEKEYKDYCDNCAFYEFC